RPDKRGRPVADRPSRTRHTGALALSPRGPRMVLLAHLDRLHINPDGAANRHAVVAGTTRQISRVGTCDEGLSGRASGIDAGAAEEPAFDHGHLLPCSYKTPGQRRAGLPGPDNDGIVIVHALPFSS